MMIVCVLLAREMLVRFVKVIHKGGGESGGGPT